MTLEYLLRVSDLNRQQELANTAKFALSNALNFLLIHKHSTRNGKMCL
mgnify:CR=1 FL=1